MVLKRIVRASFSRRAASLSLIAVASASSCSKEMPDLNELVGIAFALATLCIGDGFGKQARSMEVEVRVEMIAAERINEGREALRDVAVAKLFTYDRSIL